MVRRRPRPDDSTRSRSQLPIGRSNDSRRFRGAQGRRSDAAAPQACAAGRSLLRRRRLVVRRSWSSWTPKAGLEPGQDGARASATRAVKGGVTSSASMAGMRSGKIPLTASTPGRRQRHRCLIRDNPRPSWPGPAHDRDAGAVAAPRLVRCGAARRITCRCSMDRTCSQTPASLMWRASPEGGVPSLGGPSSAYTWPSGLTGGPRRISPVPPERVAPPGRWTGGDRSPRSAAGSASAASVPAASWTHHIGSPGDGSRE